VGKAVSVPEELNGALLNQNAVILRTKKYLENKFLFYLLKSDMFKGYIINMAQGAANQASITLDSIFRFPFFRPPVEEQQKSPPSSPPTTT
jgi:Type I restriction modification DNA specificity domain.